MLTTFLPLLDQNREAGEPRQDIKFKLFSSFHRQATCFSNSYGMNAISRTNDTANTTTPSIRQIIWGYLQQHQPRMIGVADNIARGAIQPPPPSPGLPPLNFLANAEPPSSYPFGLGARIHSTSTNDLAAGKRSNVEGFAAQTTAGLAILLGTWSDYCLYCWAKWGSTRCEESIATLVLTKDHGTLDDIQSTPRQGCTPLIPGVDWGEREVKDFYKSSDPSTVNLFTSIYRAGNPVSSCAVFGRTASTQAQNDLELFIAEKQLFVFNVWPWFRSGKSSTSTNSIHPKLYQVPGVKEGLSDLIQCLSPRKIAALGAWGYECAAPSATYHLQNAYLPYWFKGTAEVFRHPSAYSTCGWHRTWQAPPQWGGGMRWEAKTNAQAFENFIT